MRLAIRELQLLGRLPTETITDDETLLPLIQQYDELLQAIEQPLTLTEAQVLITLFPEGLFYDLHWDLIRLVESVEGVDEPAYLELIDSCPSQDWKELLRTRHQNREQKHSRR